VSRKRKFFPSPNDHRGTYYFPPVQETGVFDYFRSFAAQPSMEVTKSFETVKVTVDDDGIALLVLNRPDRLNAFNNKMSSELITFFKDVVPYEDKIKVVKLLNFEQCQIKILGSSNWSRKVFLCGSRSSRNEIL
jgi:hypothetical protein